MVNVCAVPDEGPREWAYMEWDELLSFIAILEEGCGYRGVYALNMKGEQVFATGPIRP